MTDDNETMVPRYLSLAMGLVYLLVGIVGFIPALYTTPPANAPHLTATAAFGYLLGIFPVNAVHDIVHIVVGIAGILAGASLRTARVYGKLLFLVFGLLTVIGFVPALDTLGGLIPLYGSDTFLHAATAIVGAVIGWIAGEETNEAPVSHAT